MPKITPNLGLVVSEYGDNRIEHNFELIDELVGEKTVGLLATNEASGKFSPSNMTNNTTPAPFVVSGVGYANGYYLFNGTDTANYVNLAVGNYVQLDTGNSYTLGRYSLRIKWLTTSVKAFELLGSNDGTTFTLIDSQANLTWAADNDQKFFTVPENTPPYRHFRLKIVTLSTPSTDLLELELYTGNSTTQLIPVDITGVQNGYALKYDSATGKFMAKP
jgi:hypothetical protein